jgi:GAF domain-containing protein
VIFALVLAIGFGLVFSNLIARSISSRLITLGNDALALQDNLLDRRTVISMGGRDEIALVSRSFDEMSRRLSETFSDLEKKVDERTANLATATAESNKRAQQFEAITKVARSISATQDLQELLPQISRVISEQFGFYHVGIFLNDFTNRIAMLSAANSEGGQRMLARGHQLKIGEQGIVGFVTGTGQPRIALDVGDDAVFFNNPDLPNTRSEMALPLKIADKIVGALDVQSTESNAFSSEDVEVLSILADQVSVAIQNARLFEQIGKALAESEAVSRQYLRESWGRLSSEHKLTGFRYTASGAFPLDNDKATNDGKAPPAAKINNERPYVKIPIQLRGETIGALKVHAPETGKLTDIQVDLIKAVAERVALSVENARLFEETEKRAERERRVSDITTKIRSANDPQQMINTAIDELRRALGATLVEVVPQRLSDMTDK